MAKKLQSTAATVAASTPVVANNQPTVQNGEPNRSELIRQYKATNPDAGPSAIAKALSVNGVEISSSLVSSVLGGRRNGVKGIDVNTVKLAAAFVKQYKGKIEDAAAAIESVGQYIDECGGSEQAKAALTTFKELSSALN